MLVQGATDALPWENQTAGAGAGPSAAAPGGSALQPWGNSGPGAASPGQERSGNAEITPLEVTTPKLAARFVYMLQLPAFYLCLTPLW